MLNIPIFLFLFTLALAEIINDALDPKMPESLQQLVYQIESTHLSSPPSITFSHHLRDLKITEGDKLFLKCTVVTVPSAVFYWEHNGTRVQEDHTVNMHEKILNIGNQVDGSGTVSSYFHIPCATSNSSGTYKCVATNGRTIVESSAQIAVEAKNVSCGSSNETAPLITTNTDIRLQLTGNVVTLNCRANKPTDFEWIFQNSLIDKNGSRHEILENGDLIIKNITLSDLGDYTCIARNEYGEARVNCMLFPILQKTTSEQEVP